MRRSRWNRFASLRLQPADPTRSRPRLLLRRSDGQGKGEGSPEGDPLAAAEADVSRRVAPAAAALASILKRLESPSGAAAGAETELQRSQQAADQLHAQLKAAQEAWRRSRDDAAAVECRVKALEAELEERSERIEVLERRVFKLQKRVDEGLEMNSLRPAGAPAPTLAPAAASGPGSNEAAAAVAAAAASDVQSQKLLAECMAQAEELRQRLSRAESEHERERELRLSAQEELSRGLEAKELAFESERAALRRQLADGAAALQRSQEELQAVRAERRTWDQLKAEVDRALAAVTSDTAGPRPVPAEWRQIERHLAEQASHLQQLSQAETALRQLVEEQAAEVRRRQDLAERHRIKSDALQAAIQEAQEARAQLAARDLEIDRVRRAAGLGPADRAAPTAAEAPEDKPLREQLADLQALVDVLTTMCQDDADAVEALAAKRRLELRVAELEEQLRAGPAAGAGAGTADAARQRDEAVAQAESLRLELASCRQVLAETREQLENAQQEAEVFMRELEAVGAEYERSQAKAASLVSKLAEQEQASNAILHQKLLYMKQLGKAVEERDAVRAMCERLGQQVQAIGQQVAERGGREAEALQRAAEAEALRGHERHDLELAFRSEKESLVRERGELKRKLERASADCEEERRKRQRLREDRDALAQRVERLLEGREPAPSSSGRPSSDMEEELLGLRKLLNCSVCHEKPKSGECFAAMPSLPAPRIKSDPDRLSSCSHHHQVQPPVLHGLCGEEPLLTTPQVPRMWPRLLSGGYSHTSIKPCSS